MALAAPYWRNKVVLITGGSGGLGLELARAFCASEARVISVARDATRLEQSVRAIAEAGGQIVGKRADVTREDDVRRLMDEIANEFGQLNVLVNNVGVSTRGSVLDTSPADFQSLWETNFLSVVNCVRGAVPLLSPAPSHIVNIGSLASKSAARFLGGYPATKFAVAAYSQQLRYELEPRGIHVLLVCPGPIRRADAGTRYANQAAGLPESARKPGGGVKVKGIDPAWLARRVLRACEHREREVVVPAKARLLFAIQQLSPSLGDWLVQRLTSG